MKTLILLFIFLQPGIRYYYFGLSHLGTGSITTTDSYKKHTNVDSLINIYDTVKVSTRYGFNIYVR